MPSNRVPIQIVARRVFITESFFSLMAIMQSAKIIIKIAMGKKTNKEEMFFNIPTFSKLKDISRLP